MALLFQYGNLNAIEASSNIEVLRGDAAIIAHSYDKLFAQALRTKPSQRKDAVILGCMAEVSHSAEQLTTKKTGVSQSN